MTSQRPYLIRAIYQWLLDNEFTPHLLVNANFPNTEVPQDFVNKGSIILNINPSSIQHLQMENDFISFNARFNGVAHQIFIPPQAVLGIFAKENNQGMLFPEIETDLDPEPPKTTPSKSRPTLKIVK